MTPKRDKMNEAFGNVIIKEEVMIPDDVDQIELLRTIATKDHTYHLPNCDNIKKEFGNSIMLNKPFKQQSETANQDAKNFGVNPCSKMDCIFDRGIEWDVLSKMGLKCTCTDPLELSDNGSRRYKPNCKQKKVTPKITSFRVMSTCNGTRKYKYKLNCNQKKGKPKNTSVGIMSVFDVSHKYKPNCNQEDAIPKSTSVQVTSLPNQSVQITKPVDKCDDNDNDNENSDKPENSPWRKRLRKSKLINYRYPLKKLSQKKVKIEENCENIPKRFPCESCDKIFDREESLSLHCLTEHNIPVADLPQNDEKPFRCIICHRKFIRECHLQSHQKIHLENPITCCFCKQRFTKESSLQSHLQIHESELTNPSQYNKITKQISSIVFKFKCVHCKKKFGKRSQLLNHEKDEHETYECDACKKMNCSQDLENHSENKSILKCSLCSRLFEHNSDLSNHLIVHEQICRNEEEHSYAVACIRKENHICKVLL